MHYVFRDHMCNENMFYNLGMYGLEIQKGPHEAI